ncbi:MAG: hypothetical protein HFF09_03050 [Oscillospiraceae bacterium]|nr:hypothetical protein [Oscillospiraceae bacterium]
MYVARCDIKIVNTTEVRKMLEEYKKKFGESFISFNYGDFQRQGDKCAGQVYKETLEKALQDDKPYHIVSHRYDVFDH